MKAVSLIALNLVREQRWPLLTLILYVVLFGGSMALVPGSAGEDELFFLRSSSMYGLAFTALLAASAINNERRSRRILAVLSKGIERGEYLGGVLAGAMLGALVYCAAIFAIGIATSWSAASIGVFILVLLALYLRTATLALMLSTMLHPLLATATAALLLAAEGLLARALGGVWLSALPSWILVDRAVNFGHSGWHAPWYACTWALAHTVVLWAIATAIFSRRDIAVAVE